MPLSLRSNEAARRPPRLWRVVAALVVGHATGLAVSLAAVLAVGLATVLAVGLATSGPLRAQTIQSFPPDGPEEILDYRVEVDLRDGNRMVVTEEITVRALGQRIQRGIYREFPTSFPRFIGLGRIEAPFEVREVRRDGSPEPWSLERFGGSWGRGGVRVRIGDAAVYLDEGIHRYALTYETARWISHLDEADEFYWNVTGNGWEFPIGQASAVVRFPRTASDDDVLIEAWTGPEGATTSDASWDWDSATGRATIETDRPLGAGEGLTIRLTVPSGTILPATPSDRRRWFIADWGPWLEGASVLLLVLVLYISMWLLVGRDPHKGAVVVQYEPPEGFSPAALGFLQERGYAAAQRTAAVVSLAVQGALKIEQDGSDWTLRRTRDGIDAAPNAAPEEKALYEQLLGSRKRLKLSNTQAAALQAGTKALRVRLKSRLEREYFVLNRKWFFAGLAMSVLGLIVLAWRDPYGVNPVAWFLMFWLSGWTIGTGSLLYRAFQLWKAALSGKGAGTWAAAFAATAFAAPFTIAELVVGGILLTMVPQALAATALLLGAVNVLFYHLLERPTLKGRGVLGRLEGFKRYLSAADQDRLDRLMPPERTPALFERYLPHAMALGLENRWADTFADVLTPAAVATATTAGALAWYSSSGSRGADGLSGMASSLGSSFSNSLSSASSPPSSGGSGGSSSGGSSGGGGGGGGGGGW